MLEDRTEPSCVGVGTRQHYEAGLSALCVTANSHSDDRSGSNASGQASQGWIPHWPQTIPSPTEQRNRRVFQDIERRRLLPPDVAELRAVAGDADMDILGPPLSDEEVRQIIAEAEVS